jgi:hypothetical protein
MFHLDDKETGDVHDLLGKPITDLNYIFPFDEPSLHQLSTANSEKIFQHGKLYLLEEDPTIQKFLESYPGKFGKASPTLLSLHSGENIFQNSENSENLGNQTSIKKKGKSTPLPEDIEKIIHQIKTHYENKDQKVPSLFRKDGIRKKIKTHFSDWIKKLIDEKKFQVTGDKKSKFKKLNQDTIANINIRFNSVLLNKTLFEVYYDDCEENKNLIQILLNNSNTEILQFLDTPLYLLYNEYLISLEFKKDFKKIEKKINNLKKEAETEEDKKIISFYLKIYEIFSENFVDYFMKTSPNQRSSETNRMSNRDN